MDGPGAIVFTDIVGFTELTELHGDEAALALLDRQDEVVRRTVGGAGRIVKELGDGLLLWFDRADAAIGCSLRLQHVLAGRADDPLPLWVRIGLHWGRPRRRGDDLIGRDVNLASRISELAGPGEVLCSGAAVDQAGDVPGVRTIPLGAVFVKGVPDAVPVHRAVLFDPAALSRT